jgi:hypothetical protein
MWHIFNMKQYSVKKEWNPVICRSVDASGGHYAEWKEPDMQKQAAHDPTH